MRPIVTETIAELPPLPDELLDEARGSPPIPENHARFVRTLAPFHLIEEVSAAAGCAVAGPPFRRRPSTPSG